MKTVYRAAPLALAASLLLTLGACSNMTSRQKDIAVGAGVGAAAGAVVTRGSVLGTGVGAAVGGVIGDELHKERKENK